MYFYHMDESLDLPVWYNDKEMILPAELQPWKLSHPIIVHNEIFHSYLQELI